MNLVKLIARFWRGKDHNGGGHGVAPRDCSGPASLSVPGFMGWHDAGHRLGSPRFSNSLSVVS